MKYGYRKDIGKYRYHLEFKDSYLILLNSLTKLSKNFLSDQPELMKLENSEQIISRLLDPNLYYNTLSDKTFLREVLYYCKKDCLSLGHIISKFSIII